MAAPPRLPVPAWTPAPERAHQPRFRAPAQAAEAALHAPRSTRPRSTAPATRAGSWAGGSAGWRWPRGRTSSEQLSPSPSELRSATAAAHRVKTRELSVSPRGRRRRALGRELLASVQHELREQPRGRAARRSSPRRERAQPGWRRRRELTASLRSGGVRPYAPRHSLHSLQRDGRARRRAQRGTRHAPAVSAGAPAVRRAQPAVPQENARAQRPPDERAPQRLGERAPQPGEPVLRARPDVVRDAPPGSRVPRRARWPLARVSRAAVASC